MAKVKMQNGGIPLDQWGRPLPTPENYMNPRYLGPIPTYQQPGQYPMQDVQPLPQNQGVQNMNWGSSSDYLQYANDPTSINTGMSSTNGSPTSNYSGAVSGIQQGAQAIGNVIDTIGDIKKGFLKAAPTVLNALLPENHNQRQRAPQMAYNQDPYGRQFNNMFQDGGSVTKAKQILQGNRDLGDRERNFFEFIGNSTTDNTMVQPQPYIQDDFVDVPQPQYQNYIQSQWQDWQGGTPQDTQQYNQGYYQGIYGQPEMVPLTTPLLEGYSEGTTRRRMLKPEHQPKQFGGFVPGQEVELTPQQIKELEKQGYKLEY